MAINKTSTVFHVLALMHHFYVWSIVVKLDFNKLPETDLLALKKLKNMGGRFLTNWNFFQQTLYLIIALLIDALPLILSNHAKFTKRLSSFNGYNFITIVIPFSLYIPLLFWTVYNYDRSLVYPVVLDLVIPGWANHSLHTVIALIIVVELFITRRRPPVFHKAFVGLTLYAGLYVAVLVATYFQHGVWLYEYLGVIDWPIRVLYFGVTYALLVLFLKMGHAARSYLYKGDGLAQQNSSTYSMAKKKRT